MRGTARWPALCDESGYSLIELVTVMALLGIVLGALTTLYVAGTSTEVRLNRAFDAQNNARLALERIRRDAHCASTMTPTGTSGSVTMTLPTTCSAGSGTITWCTQGSGQRWGLYRIAGSACSGGTQYADYITTQNVFTYTASQTGTKLAYLYVNFPVNVAPAAPTNTSPTYRLEDNIVLHNSTR